MQKPMMPSAKYPKFFRLAGKCVKVVSDTESRTIILPPDVSVPCRFEDTYPDADRMQVALKDMEECSQDIYCDFLTTFYGQVHEEHARYSEYKRKQREEIENEKKQIINTN